ncbi:MULTISPECIES: STAS domain-containing protein [unclassified Bacillus (in: firmicutes)]|uniref:STAS domain-containing protein n=1 Tax=unclassified Bacillus (in: firmicutes) TaxID=185979 RepID=UPI0008EC2B95|nr:MULTISPECIES: STAS domain-containing protein [unclassified Bacillus (in: firmicutes)]SFB04541.1 rsbT co-antagonist protein RsbR [Bacillus sp. UNCCL13]SFQ88489.1 rsbT co-antagonist protein RsbR [Bacillus sp. cl95]
MTSFFNISQFLSENAKSLAVEIVEGVLCKMNLNIPNWEKEQAINMYIELLGFLGESLHKGEEGIPQELIAWSKSNGEREASSGGKISEIVVRYPPTREIFSDLITRISTDYGLAVEDHATMTKKVNAILDVSINETVFAFERLADKIEAERQKEFAKLSAPVVPIKDGIAVLPLIGAIDSFRANHILENVVPELSELKLRYLIIDFSGILNIDFEVAHYFVQIQGVLQLIGIETLVTGIRPELAQTVVNAGMDKMATINSYAHVKQALESIK